MDIFFFFFTFIARVLQEQSRQNVQEQTIPKIFPNLEKLLAGNSYFVGDQVRNS